MSHKKAMSLVTDFLLISFLPFHTSNKSLTLVVSLNFSLFTCLVTPSSHFASSFLASFLYSLRILEYSPLVKIFKVIFLEFSNLVLFSSIPFSNLDISLCVSKNLL